MVEKIVEMFTPEMIAIAILSLTALTVFTFLMVLITIVSLSRVKKDLLSVAERSAELEEKHAALQQVRQTMSNTVARLTEVDDKIESIERRSDEFDNKIAGLAEAADKIGSIERHLNGFDHKIAENRNQLTGHESKLKEHDTLLGQAGQMMGKEAAGFNQAVQRIRILEEEFQGLKVFQRTFEQTRNRILNVLGATPGEMPPRNALTTEQKDPKGETVIQSEGKLPDTEGFDKSRMRYRYP